MYLVLDVDSQVGGVCGNMGCYNPNILSVQGAQLYEYTLGHIYDKAYESITGFIHVLPGAYSAYRSSAINNEEMLRRYLRISLDPEWPLSDDFKCSDANMYLAEDRLLCLGIYTNGYMLKYIPDAYGDTDVEDTLIGLAT